MQTIAPVPVSSVRFVKELYPRLREDDATIERYRDSIELLPPIAIARDGLLVDGFHRWQAHIREHAAEIMAEDLGNLSDAEIIRESISRNATHGQQLSQADKKRLAGELWLKHFAGLKESERYSEITALLSASERSVRGWTKDARHAEKEEAQAEAWDRWLNCESERQIGDALGVDHTTIGKWVVDFGKRAEIHQAPDSRQHFDIWSFAQADDSAGTESYFGRMPAQFVENLLWFYTEPGQIVVDPFAGGGTTIDVAKRMGRRVWASDLVPSTPLLPIHQHDITTGWPDGAPSKASLILLDPPYWKQAAGRYSDDANDLGNLSLAEFDAAWDKVLSACTEHLTKSGRIAFVISPTVDGDKVVDHAFSMYSQAIAHGLTMERRIIGPYQTQQATGQQVTWARENKQMLKLYRDIVVMQWQQ